MTADWTLVFKLRNNIPLEGDVELARRELCALTGTTVEPIDADALRTLFTGCMSTKRSFSLGWRERSSICAGARPCLTRSRAVARHWWKRL